MTTPMVKEMGCQTEESEPIRPTIDSTRENARKLGQFTTDARCLRATVKDCLKAHLRMPSSANASMQVTMPFSAIPLMAWKMLYPKGIIEWHSERTKDKSTHVGLILCPQVLNTALDLGTMMYYGKGCTKLVVPPDGGAARSMIGYAPPFKIWHQASANGTMQSMLSAYLVILDESGEMRTPPNHAYTDQEELAIKAVMIENLKKFSDWDFPMSDMLAEHLDAWETAEAEQLRREEESDLSHLSLACGS